MRHIKYLKRWQIYFWQFCSGLGSSGIFFLIILLFLFIDKSFSLTVFFNYFVIMIIVYLIKTVHFEPRPDNLSKIRIKLHHFKSINDFKDINNYFNLWKYVDESTMPSAHAARAMNLLVLLTYYFASPALISIFVVITGFTIYSRYIKKRHYPFDLAIGSLIGLVVSLFFIFV